jgi:hypothetical protein
MTVFLFVIFILSLFNHLVICKIIYSSLIVTGYRLDDRSSISTGGGIFLFATMYRAALESTQSPIQWVAGSCSLSVKLPGTNLATHHHQVPRLKMYGAVTPLPMFLRGVLFN